MALRVLPSLSLAVTEDAVRKQKRLVMFVPGLVAGLMALYGYYLGHRRQVEERQGISLSPSLLRCPFVMGILSKSSGSAVAGVSKG